MSWSRFIINVGLAFPLIITQTYEDNQQINVLDYTLYKGIWIVDTMICLGMEQLQLLHL
jgi:hypothetical protein